jgi:hypothetical protein
MRQKTITGENVFTDPFNLNGFFNVSIQGTFVATVSLMRSFDNGDNWETVSTWTEPVSTSGFEPMKPFVKANQSLLYKLGVATGDFTSGSITVKLG